MMVYLDSSALVKLYGEEAGALDTIDLLDDAEMVAISPITRVEVASALARAVRTRMLAANGGREAYRAFIEESHALVQVPVTDRVLTRAQDLVWEHGLRGYDAVQLASALTWQDRVGMSVTLATFDVQLAGAAGKAGMEIWPDAIHP